MSRQERLDYLNTERNERLVQHYDDPLGIAEALVLVYPSWWYGMPAMLKGYFDRVWLPGVALDVTSTGTVKTDRLKRLGFWSSPPMADPGGWCEWHSATLRARSSVARCGRCARATTA